jgi:hypothetical protein
MWATVVNRDGLVCQVAFTGKIGGVDGVSAISANLPAVQKVGSH